MVNLTYSIGKFDSIKDLDMDIVKRVKELTEKYGVRRTQVALAYLLAKPVVASPIVGVTKLSQLEDSVKAVNLKLTDEDVAYLEEPYVPHRVVGAIDKNPD